ncbi:ATP-binding cassette subfamily B multidrug efflux pump [Aequitasia blattaphilus]|uniref:ABC transporter ATP-binding protein/permease n=1 Tax=Aequitasia blattaphilus TaxID=2949332 RepID=A0ABT1E8W4_9FIRM|nr:ABC transporter ATP-binding protein [Aequitasia blattaphilus]MCP1102271.1 ABC transporter ATP-binding protein/permease [Aequitasia blattaphilus]MCR8614911.1 ABC transporter ATP-binding protein/permease [Aequitasia blattaphilus]
MGKLVKFLKPYMATVAAIFAILILQVYCDLSLPTYTSDIVNVGIQQKGISEKVPYHITNEDLQSLLMLSKKEDQEFIQKSYEEGNKEGILELKESVKDSEKDLSKLEKSLKGPMFLVLALQEQGTNQQGGQQMAPGQNQEVPSVDELQKQYDIPDTMLEQSSAAYIEKAYINADVNMDKVQTSYILNTGGKMLLLALLGMLASVSVGFLAARTGAGVGRTIRKGVFTKVVGFSNGEFDKFSTASLITRSTNDIQQIQMILTIMLRLVLYAPIMAIGGVWKVFQTNVNMSWILAVAVGLVLAVVFVLFLVVMPKFKIVQKQLDRINLVSREILTGIPVIRAFTTQRHEEERFDDANKAFTKTNLFVNRAMTFMMPAMMLIMNCITVLIVWVGASGIDSGNMQVGDMMAFIQYTMQIIMSFLMISMISVMLPRAAVSAERVDEVLRSETLIKDPERVKTISEKGNGKVEFKNVSFRYPGAEEDVLSQLSFTANPGETTAIIGSTGSGKSTMVHLIPRFYDVTEGSVTVDGVDIRDIAQHDLRERIGFIPQKGVLFSGDIRSNILYSNEDAGDDVMKDAARVAQASEFIEEKEEGYDSPISQGGTNVSGGQKQRISIARAIAKNPEIYIFDDSFSALDYQTDVTLRKELKKKTADSTVLIVAQRISTILHAEKILVLDEGKIVGQGTHKELLKSCEEYYQIASSQLSEEELNRDIQEVG